MAVVAIAVVLTPVKEWLLGIYAFSALLHFMYVGDAGIIVGDFEM